MFNKEVFNFVYYTWYQYQDLPAKLSRNACPRHIVILSPSRTFFFPRWHSNKNRKIKINSLFRYQYLTSIILVGYKNKTTYSGHALSADTPGVFMTRYPPLLSLFKILHWINICAVNRIVHYWHRQWQRNGTC